MANIDKTTIAVTVGTLTLTSPLVIVSGVFGYGQEFQKLAGFNPEDAGAVVLKGVSQTPWTGNPPPRIVETTAGMLNSIGLQNIGIEKLVLEKLPLWENVKTNVVVNVVGHSVEEYIEVSKVAVTSSRVDAIELNLSCPNISRGGIAFGTDPELVKSITERVRDIVSDRPVWVKLTPNVEHIEPLAIAAVEGGASAISLINTVRGMAINIEKRRPILSRNIGGLSGPAIKPIALLKIGEVYKALLKSKLDVPIIGMGGVMNGEDVIEFMIAGANAVGIGTVLFYDPHSVKRINQEIKSKLHSFAIQSERDDDYKLSTYIGSLKWNE